MEALPQCPPPLLKKKKPPEGPSSGGERFLPHFPTPMGEIVNDLLLTPLHKTRREARFHGFRPSGIPNVQSFWKKFQII